MVGRENLLARLPHVNLVRDIDGWVDQQLRRRPSIDVPVARHLILRFLRHLSPVVPLTGSRERLRIGDGLDAPVGETHRRLLRVEILGAAQFLNLFLRLVLADEARGGWREEAETNEIYGLQIIVRALSD